MFISFHSQTIASTSPTAAMLRRSIAFNTLGQFSEGASIARIASIQSNQSQSATAATYVGTAQSVRGQSAAGGGYLLQQQHHRSPQFLSGGIQSLSSSVSSSASPTAAASRATIRTTTTTAAVGLANYGSTLTPVQQILRPRHMVCLLCAHYVQW